MMPNDDEGHALILRGLQGLPWIETDTGLTASPQQAAAHRCPPDDAPADERQEHWAEEHEGGDSDPTQWQVWVTEPFALRAACMSIKTLRKAVLELALEGPPAACSPWGEKAVRELQSTATGGGQQKPSRRGPVDTWGNLSARTCAVLVLAQVYGDREAAPDLMELFAEPPTR